MLSKSQLQVKLRILMRMWRNLNSNKLIHTESDSGRVRMLELLSRRYFSISLCSLIYLKPLSSSLFVWTCLPVKKIFNASFLWNSLDLTLAIIDSHQRAVCQFKEAVSGGLFCIMTDTALDKVKLMWLDISFSLIRRNHNVLNSITMKPPNIQGILCIFSGATHMCWILIYACSVTR